MVAAAGAPAARSTSARGSSSASQRISPRRMASPQAGTLNNSRGVVVSTSQPSCAPTMTQSPSTM